jgi:hypothetical protein
VDQHAELEPLDDSAERAAFVAIADRLRKG